MGLEPRLWGVELTVPDSAMFLVGQVGSGANSTKRITTVNFHKGYSSGNKVMIGANTTGGTCTVKGSDDDTGNVLLNPAGGKVGIGTTAVDELLHIEDSTADSNPAIQIENDVQAWALQTRGAGSDVFVIRDVTGSDNVVVLVPGAPSNSLHIASDGRTGITGVPATSAALDVTSTTGALLVPRMTTTQRDSLTAANGMIIYNTTTNQMEGRINGAWSAM